MKRVSAIYSAKFILLSALIIIGANTINIAQEGIPPVIDRDSLLSVARELIGSHRYCALTTIGSTGYPHTRVMDAFKPDENMVIWLGTTRYSRKVKEITANPKVSIIYYDNKGIGYVSIIGTASMIDDSTLKAKYWKPEWERFYPDKSSYTLIKVIPENLEVLNMKYGIYGDPRTWKSPTVKFDQVENNE
jgi:general stress protein 26